MVLANSARPSEAASVTMCPASESSASDPAIQPPMASTTAKPAVSKQCLQQRAPDDRPFAALHSPMRVRSMIVAMEFRLGRGTGRSHRAKQVIASLCPPRRRSGDPELHAPRSACGQAASAKPE